MHPATQRYVEQINHLAKLNKRDPLNGLAVRFLDQVWGPVFDYRFEGLEAEMPFRDIRGKQRFADFRYTDGIVRTAIELDGYTTHAKNISSAQFDDHLERQNDLLLQGWFLLRFSSGMVIEKPEVCRRQLMQALGRWHYVRAGGLSEERASIWEFRMQRIVRIALRQGGYVRPRDVTRAFKISSHTASEWLRKLARDGWLEPVGGVQRITGYRILNTFRN